MPTPQHPSTAAARRLQLISKHFCSFNQCADLLTAVTAEANQERLAVDDSVHANELECSDIMREHLEAEAECDEWLAAHTRWSQLMQAETPATTGEAKPTPSISSRLYTAIKETLDAVATASAQAHAAEEEAAALTAIGTDNLLRRIVAGVKSVLVGAGAGVASAAAGGGGAGSLESLAAEVALAGLQGGAYGAAQGGEAEVARHVRPWLAAEAHRLAEEYAGQQAHHVGQKVQGQQQQEQEQGLGRDREGEDGVLPTWRYEMPLRDHERLEAWVQGMLEIEAHRHRAQQRQRQGSGTSTPGGRAVQFYDGFGVVPVAE